MNRAELRKIFIAQRLPFDFAALTIERIWESEIKTSGKACDYRRRIRKDEGRRTLGRDLRLLELIVDNIDDLIAVIDSQGRRVWNNAAYARVLGYSVESLAGSNSLIEVHPDDLPKVQGSSAGFDVVRKRPTNRISTPPSLRALRLS